MTFALLEQNQKKVSSCGCFVFIPTRGFLTKSQHLQLNRFANAIPPEDDESMWCHKPNLIIFSLCTKDLGKMSFKARVNYFQKASFLLFFGFRIPPNCHHAARDRHRCHFNRCQPCQQACDKPLPRCSHRCPWQCHTAVLIKQVENKVRPEHNFIISELPLLKRDLQNGATANLS